jgi:hypothetical protein
MRFEERELKPYAEPISASELKEGLVYFSVTFIDDDMLIPLVETLVFIGRDLEPGDSGQVYFQDIGSHHRGIRYGATTEDDYANFLVGSENELGHLFDYEHALDLLMKCSLRRRKAGRL